jgi:hypothetical protein
MSSFISKLKTVEKHFSLQRMFTGVMVARFGSAPRTFIAEFIAEVLFIDLLEIIFGPISEFRRKFDCDDPSILIVDEHSTFMMLHVIALDGARNVTLIRLVAHSSHLAQPLDLCVFG